MTNTPQQLNTHSVCPVCLRTIAAALVRRDADWYLEKRCPEHGAFQTVVWRGDDPDLLNWGRPLPAEDDGEDAFSCPHQCGLCQRHLRHTCCILIEVTDRCNLRCPVCFAQSGDWQPRPEKTVEELAAAFRDMVAAGRTFIQLSGGEPTVRDDLPAIVRAAKAAGATSVQLNSNGLRLAAEPGYTAALAEAGLDFVFMQFDGVTDEPGRRLRGRPLLAQKTEALRLCGEHGLGVTLVPTIVPGVNDDQIGAILRFGLERSPVVRGVHFQPVSYFGRYPQPPADADRITLPEIVVRITEQTHGLIPADSLVPSACDHPRCGFHGDYVVLPDGLCALSSRQKQQAACCCCQGEKDDPALRNRNFVARRWTRHPQTPEAGTDLTDFDNFLHRCKSHGFTVTGMAFQDVWTLDCNRLRQCSLHVYDDGKIVPFCAYYLSASADCDPDGACRPRKQ